MEGYIENVQNDITKFLAIVISRSTPAHAIPLYMLIISNLWIAGGQHAS